jgi:hypothetical protein
LNQQISALNKIYVILLFGFLIIGCKPKVDGKQLSEQKSGYNKELAAKLKEMAQIDQYAASHAFPPEEHSGKFTQENWEQFKDSIFRTNQNRAQEILNKYGFVGYDLAGKEGSMNFWLIVQHSDHNLDFQNEALQKMKKEIDKGNAEATSYGLLLDRVKLNTGKEQVYGTQVAYNPNNGQAYPRKLADSVNVNKRRKSIGLEPLEIYLNQMTEMHFEMNKEGMLKHGITKPKLYKTD